VSWLCAIGIVPSCETSPAVGLTPTLSLFPEGQTMEPSRFRPHRGCAKIGRRCHRRTCSIHTDRSSADDGSRVKPPRALQPLNGALPRKFAHSERFALPRMTAPAARNTIHHHGIRRNDAAYECERSCCRLHFVSSCEVVLHQDRKISLNLASR